VKPFPVQLPGSLDIWRVLLARGVFAGAEPAGRWGGRFADRRRR